MNSQSLIVDGATARHKTVPMRWSGNMSQLRKAVGGGGVGDRAVQNLFVIE